MRPGNVAFINQDEEETPALHRGSSFVTVNKFNFHNVESSRSFIYLFIYFLFFLVFIFLYLSSE